jgi:hypothetical protein
MCRERALEATVDKAASHTETDGALVGHSVESVKGGESLIEALDLVESELVQSQQSADYKASPLLMGLTPYKYIVRSLKQVRFSC